MDGEEAAQLAAALEVQVQEQKEALEGVEGALQVDPEEQEMLQLAGQLREAIAESEAALLEIKRSQLSEMVQMQFGAGEGSPDGDQEVGMNPPGCLPLQEHGTEDKQRCMPHQHPTQRTYGRQQQLGMQGQQQEQQEQQQWQWRQRGPIDEGGPSESCDTSTDGCSDEGSSSGSGSDGGSEDVYSDEEGGAGGGGAVVGAGRRHGAAGSAGGGDGGASSLGDEGGGLGDAGDTGDGDGPGSSGDEAYGVVRMALAVANAQAAAAAAAGPQSCTARLAEFECHTRGIGSKLLLGMGWRGGGLGSMGQGMEAPLEVVLRSAQAGLGSKGDEGGGVKQGKRARRKKKRRGGERARRQQAAAAGRGKAALPPEESGMFALLNRVNQTTQRASEDTRRPAPLAPKGGKQEGDRRQLVEEQDHIRGLRTDVKRLQEMAVRQAGSPSVLVQVQKRLGKVRAALSDAQARHLRSTKAVRDKEAHKKWTKF